MYKTLVEFLGWMKIFLFGFLIKLYNINLGSILRNRVRDASKLQLVLVN